MIQGLTPQQEEAHERNERYDEWLLAFTSQHRVPTVDLIPARKLERLNAVEQHQKELEIEFEARFPALYRKAQAMRPAAAMEDAPSPTPSPPPPFHSEHLAGRSFRDVDWTGPGKEDDEYFELRKVPLIEPLVSGLEKMRAAGNLQSPDPGSASRGYPAAEDYPVKGKMDVYADDYDHEYDEIDPKSEGFGSEAGFPKVGVSDVAEAVAADAGGGKATTQERKDGGDTLTGKATKKRPQIWERLRSGGGK